MDSSMQYRCIIHLNTVIGPTQTAELGIRFSLQNHTAIKILYKLNSDH